MFAEELTDLWKKSSGSFYYEPRKLSWWCPV